MKKSYIAPEVGVYAVNLKNSMLFSTSGTEVDAGSSLVKEEKEEQGAGMWDLYK